MLFYFWVYTLIVILWGAWVRISHSGDGCGTHWPLCGGELIPDLSQKKTWIEYTHRLMTGVYGLLVFSIFFKIKKQVQSRFVRTVNWSLLILMITEALLGALLVKGELVTTNDSVTRLIVMIFHQLNSFLLTGTTFVLFLSIKSVAENLKPLKIESLTPVFLFLTLSVSGAIAALSVTLFPSTTVWNGILQDFSSQSHLFVRLRVLHPLLASIIGIGLVTWLFSKNHTRFAFEFLIALAVGVLTVLTLSPLPLKLAHLLIAHLLWGRLIYLLVNSPDSNKR